MSILSRLWQYCYILVICFVHVTLLVPSVLACSTTRDSGYKIIFSSKLSIYDIGYTTDFFLNQLRKNKEQYTFRMGNHSTGAMFQIKNGKEHLLWQVPHEFRQNSVFFYNENVMIVIPHAPIPVIFTPGKKIFPYDIFRPFTLAKNGMENTALIQFYKKGVLFKSYSAKEMVQTPAYIPEHTCGDTMFPWIKKIDGFNGQYFILTTTENQIYRFDAITGEYNRIVPCMGCLK